jgi:hypothetical protein
MRITFNLPWPAWVKRRSWLWPVVLFCVGFGWHYLPYITWPDRFIMGDLTDSYFCLWVMEHTRTFFTTGDLRDYLDTRIFSPHNHLVLFWSENFFAPALLYSVWYFFLQHLVVAFNLTAFALIAAGFWIAYDFFRTIYYAAVDPAAAPLPPAVAAGIALLAYVVAFSDARLAFTAHFQNEMANFVLLGVSSAMRYARRPTPARLAATVGVWLLLCYSALYFALALALILAACAVFYLRAYGCGPVLHRWRSQSWILLAALVLVAPLAAGYLAVRSPLHDPAKFSSQLWHIIVPARGTRLGSTLRQVGFMVPSRSHESLAYAGIFLVPVLLALFAVRFWRVLANRSPRVRWMLLLATAGGGALAQWGLSRSEPGVAFLVPVAAVGLTGFILLRWTQPQRLPGVWLLVATLICYATALGPASGRPLQPVNPSVWGVLVKVVPAYDSLRAIGRFGALGASFALGLGWWIALTMPAPSMSGQRHNRAALAALFIAVACTALFDWPRAPYVNHYDFTALKPTRAEKQFYAQHPGRILILPATNLSLIPGHMLYFEPIPTVQLVNGYSGRFTPLIERLLTPNLPAASRVIADAIAESGATNLLLDKRAFSPEAMHQLARAYGGTSVLETPHYRLLSLPASIPSPVNAP